MAVNGWLTECAADRFRSVRDVLRRPAKDAVFGFGVVEQAQHIN